MTQRMVAVVAFEEGGDHVHWFPFVVLEYDNTVDPKELSNAIYALDREDILEYDGEYEDYTSYIEGVTETKIEAALAKAGYSVKVLPTNGMTYIAPL